MKITSASLASNLKNPAPAYLLFNDEPTLLAEDREQVRHALAHDERKLFVLDRDFDPADAELEASAGNLFDGTSLLEFILINALNADSAKQLTKIAKLAHAHQRPMIVASPPVARKGAWVSKLEDTFTVVTQSKVQRNNMTGWVKARARNAGLTLEDEAAQYIADMTTGNLSSAIQEIDKLKILHPEADAISISKIHSLLSDQSQDDPFSLREAMAEGNSSHALRAIRNLKAVKTNPALLVWAIAEEVRALLLLINGHHKPRGVFGKHLANLTQVAKRVKRSEARLLLAAIARADWAAKGMIPIDPWQDFERVVLTFTYLVRQHRNKLQLLHHEFQPFVKAA